MLLQTALESVQVSFEQLNRLYRLQALEQQATTPESQMLIRLATEQCVNTVLTDSYSVSTESVGSVVGGAIDRVWDAIVKAIAWIWNSLKKLFGFEETIEKDNKDLKYKQDEIKDIIKKGNNNAKFDEVAYLPDSLTLPFEYTGHTEIDSEQLIQFFMALEPVFKPLETIGISVQHALKVIDSLDELTPDKLTEAYNSVGVMIRQLFQEHDISITLLKQNYKDESILNTNNHRIIAQLLNNIELFFINLEIGPYVKYDFKVIKDPKVSSHPVKIPYLKLREYAEYPVKLEKIQTQYLNTQEALAKLVKHSEALTKSIMDTLRKNGDPNAIDQVGIAIVSLVKLLQSLEVVMKYIATDLHHHSAIFIENHNHYKTND